MRRFPAAFLLTMPITAWAGSGTAPAWRSPLSLDERILHQAAIEQVYYRHRIWPKENPGPRPPFEALMPPAVLGAKVQDYLEKSTALEVYWRRPATAEHLQAEMDRMARDTKDPAVLSELFAALGNDPYVIAECLARPTLVDRLVRRCYANDIRFHGEVKATADRELALVRTVEDLRSTTGTYQEIERRANDGVPPPRGLTELQEDDERFFVSVVIGPATDGTRVATVTWSKVPLDAWWAQARTRLRAGVSEPAAGRYRAPAMRATSPSCADDTWTPTAWSVSGRYEHTAVWTGTEMIVWGGRGSSNYLDTGGRYRPSTDSWLATSTPAPLARRQHTAVWTGNEMIIWGGYGSNGVEVDTGGRYDPSTDAWTPTSTAANVPGRYLHTAVWTGSEMIVWGGYSDSSYFLDTGGRYDPSTDSWVRTSTGVNVPAARRGHTAVWTGTEMIVWGGVGNSSSNDYLNTGSQYDPSTNAWVPTSIGANVPSGRYLHAAVWTGSEMIVWGGYGVSNSHTDTGGRYDPSTGSWLPTSTGANVPAGRTGHTAVWTGSKMIVWGGYDGSVLGTGGLYDPSMDSWLVTSTGANVPAGRYGATAVWTGSEMIVWGGGGSTFLNTGGRYTPTTDSWVATGSSAGMPDGRYSHTAVWTGTEMILWGGAWDRNTGSRYDPAIDSWTATSVGANVPEGRYQHTAVWTGTEMIVFGGIRSGGTPIDTGGRYNPSTDSWVATSTAAPAPAPRTSHTAVWTGTEMVVWGGVGTGAQLRTGGRYDPSTDSWVRTSTLANVPAARESHTAVWTGSEMIVWGGAGASVLDTGGRYDPSTDSWVTTSPVNAPQARLFHTAVWTGSVMIVWGGGGIGALDTGGRYDPSADSWVTTSTVNAPTSRNFHTAVWTGSEMIVWGGSDGSGYFDTGGRYNPGSDAWVATTTGASAPTPRDRHTAVWTGSTMIVWGGYGYPLLDTGALYCADGSSRRTDYVLGQGLGAPNPNEVKLYTGAGVPAGVVFFAYSAGQWGVNLSGGDIELGPYEGLLTGPGPGAGFGPHVRAFRNTGSPLNKVSYYAYGTPRYGVNVTSCNLDGDSYDEILTGAGPGAVFGPHVRAFNYDNAALTAIAKVSFFAYGTLRYGVNVSSGDVDGDTWDEIVTGAGPGPAFAATVRGFNVDGGLAASVAKINFNAFSSIGYGVSVAGGDVDADSYGEIVATPGPGPGYPSRFLGMDYDDASVTPLPGFDVTPTPFSSSFYGGRVGLGDVTNDGRADLLCGAGRDPAADARVLAFGYTGTLAPIPGTPFNPFPGRAYGVNVAASAGDY